MLFLTRRSNERVILTSASGERVEVCIMRVRGNTVHLGFVAPPGVSVHREEVQRRIDSGESEKRNGLNQTGSDLT